MHCAAVDLSRALLLLGLCFRTWALFSLCSKCLSCVFPPTIVAFFGWFLLAFFAFPAASPFGLPPPSLLLPLAFTALWSLFPHAFSCPFAVLLCLFGRHFWGLFLPALVFCFSFPFYCHFYGALTIIHSPVIVPLPISLLVLCLCAIGQERLMYSLYSLLQSVYIY